MMFDVQISEQADADLRGIYEYIAFELLSPQNAAGQLDRLEVAISNLSNMPEKFRRYEREPWHSRNLRMFPVDNYLVFYIINDSSKIVEVYRILYARKNLDLQF